MKNQNYKQSRIKQLGRAFNHLEDLVFFHGTEGVNEAIEHLRDFVHHKGSSSIRMKWDGNPQIYWGRQKAGGPLVLANHNQWSRGVIATTAHEVFDFIANKSGNTKTCDEKRKRIEFAHKFANLYNDFDKATPADFVGYVYADGLFLTPPSAVNGVYTFSPNPYSNTCYHVKQNSELGKKIQIARTMIVGHAYFTQFGTSDSAQQPMDDFDKFNINPQLIVLSPTYNKQPVEINTDAIYCVEKFVNQHTQQIDGFLESTKGLSDLKNIIYTYVNQTAKSKQLYNLSEEHFFQWLAKSKVSDSKKKKIHDLNNNFDNALSTIIELVKMIQNLKDGVIDQIQNKHGDIFVSNGEGYVRYSNSRKKFGNIKLVPRKKWTPV